MPSPFPGMNPYLEQEDAWHDFHERFLPLVAERIAAQVDPRYIVKIDEHIYIKAHYQTYIYDGAPDPPLTPHDEVWARQFLPLRP